MVLGENESSLRFPSNKIWRFTECTTPYNRPSIEKGSECQRITYNYSKLLDNAEGARVLHEYESARAAILTDASEIP